MKLNRRNFLALGTSSIASTALNSIPTTENNHSLDPQYGQTELTRISPHFPVQNSLGKIPLIDLAAWRLQILNPNNPQTLTFADLRHFPAVETEVTLACIGNPAGGEFIGNAQWRGVRLRDILTSDLPYLTFTCADGYQISLPHEVALHPSTLLAYDMNGQALAPEHGFPLRLVVSGFYGFKMPKWITQIEFASEPVVGFWESLGWSSLGEIQTHAAFTHPPQRAQISGEIRLAGYAFSRHPIVRVEISIDGGAWIPAQLISPESPQIWTLWFLDWHPDQNKHYQLAVRVHDAQGFMQTEFPNPLRKTLPLNGNQAIHTLEVIKI